MVLLTRKNTQDRNAAAPKVTILEHTIPVLMDAFIAMPIQIKEEQLIPLKPTMQIQLSSDILNPNLTSGFVKREILEKLVKYDINHIYEKELGTLFTYRRYGHTRLW